MATSMSWAAAPLPSTTLAFRISMSQLRISVLVEYDVSPLFEGLLREALIGTS
jgi:hypothetical protein